jgi:hypothetical protein
VDAVSFSRNGFDVKDSYKMFPVSPEAVKILEGAKRIIIDSGFEPYSEFLWVEILYPSTFYCQ